MGYLQPVKFRNRGNKKLEQATSRAHGVYMAQAAFLHKVSPNSDMFKIFSQVFYKVRSIYFLHYGTEEVPKIQRLMGYLSDSDLERLNGSKKKSLTMIFLDRPFFRKRKKMTGTPMYPWLSQAFARHSI